MKRKNDGLLGNEYQARAKDILSQRFIVPPFSVINTREGAWQTRKRQWLDFGVRGRNARGGGMDGEGPHKTTLAGNLGRGGEKRRDKYAKSVIDNSTSLQASLALREDEWGKRVRGSGNTHTEEFSLSHFDPVLTELMYRWFCPPNGKILDPFSGSSVAGIIAGEMGNHFTGIDICEAQVNANREQAAVVGVTPIPKWHYGDSAQVQKVLKKDERFDLIYSCPPYGDLEVYSENPHDISTMDAQTFDRTYAEIVMKVCQFLKPTAFVVFVVGDYRDKNGFYNNFPAKTIAAFLDAGLEFYNDIILVNSAGSLPLRIGAQFNGSRKVGKTHQNVLCFAKGNPREFVKGWGDVF